jgi:cyclic beta-1,2-glucan synthetase
LTLRRGSRTMRFIFVRGAALAAAAVQAEPGARPLQPGERLCWPELANVTCFVVPLPPISATSPVVTVATA